MSWPALLGLMRPPSQGGWRDWMCPLDMAPVEPPDREQCWAPHLPSRLFELNSRGLSLAPYLQRQHQARCGNELHSFCQSGIIKPPSVCSLQTGMTDQLWHKQNSRLGVNPGTDYASAGCDWGRRGFSGWLGLPFLCLKLQGPSPEPAWTPADCQSFGDGCSTLGSI